MKSFLILCAAALAAAPLAAQAAAPETEPRAEAIHRMLGLAQEFAQAGDLATARMLTERAAQLMAPDGDQAAAADPFAEPALTRMLVGRELLEFPDHADSALRAELPLMADLPLLADVFTAAEAAEVAEAPQAVPGAAAGPGAPAMQELRLARLPRAAQQDDGGVMEALRAIRGELAGMRAEIAALRAEMAQHRAHGAAQGMALPRGSVPDGVWQVAPGWPTLVTPAVPPAAAAPAAPWTPAVPGVPAPPDAQSRWRVYHSVPHAPGAASAPAPAAEAHARQAMREYAETERAHVAASEMHARSARTDVEALRAELEAARAQIAELQRLLGERGQRPVQPAPQAPGGHGPW